jgi:transposase-like protein
MSKHKSEDYKITAVKYYLENDTNYTKTCNIFKCSERSLKRWIERYEELEEIKRLNRKPIKTLNYQQSLIKNKNCHCDNIFIFYSNSKK